MAEPERRCKWTNHLLSDRGLHDLGWVIGEVEYELRQTEALADLQLRLRVEGTDENGNTSSYPSTDSMFESTNSFDGYRLVAESRDGGLLGTVAMPAIYDTRPAVFIEAEGRYEDDARDFSDLLRDIVNFKLNGGSFTMQAPGWRRRMLLEDDLLASGIEAEPSTPGEEPGDAGRSRAWRRVLNHPWTVTVIGGVLAGLLVLVVTLIVT